MNNKKLKSAGIIGGLVLAVSLAIFIWNPLQVVQWKITDLFFVARPVSDNITIIAIDNASLSTEAGLGRFKDWPRSYYAQLLRTLAAHKPAAVAFDLDFREAARGMSNLRISQLLRSYEKFYASDPKGNFSWYTQLKRFSGEDEASAHPDDDDFQKAIDENPSPVVLTSSLVFSEDVASFGDEFPAYSKIIEPIFGGENVRTGYKNVLLDRDSVLRRFVPRTEDSSSFPFAIAQAVAEANVTAGATANTSGVDTRTADSLSANISANTSTPINYYAKPFSHRMISFVDALAGNFDPAHIKGKIILVGATSQILQDFQATPTSRSPMSGAEINANIVQQLIGNEFISEQRAWSVIFLIILLALVGSFALLILPLRFMAALFAAILFGFPLAAFALYKAGFVMNAVYPELTWIAAGLATLWHRNKTELRAKRQIKKAFSHYVSPVVVNELAKDPKALQLGGKRKEISVMFSDIVGFTSLAEDMSPEDTVALLNDYLTAMTEVIFAYSGTLDKYQGDAIMALFGAPLTDEHYAANACSASLGMRRALIGLHEKWHALPELPFKDQLVQLDFRVGIATGPAVIGNVGSEKRFDYTAIGDIVNLGSRLESVNRMYGTRVIVDKNTFTAVTENHNPFVFRKLDTVRVKGKKQETEIFELVAFAETLTDDFKEMLDNFESGRILYAERNFKDAARCFESALLKIKTDGPSQIYLNRCNFFVRKPPGREWTAVVDLVEK